MSADVLSRVHKLLALATSPNLHEAAAAAAAAQGLIERHRLQALLAAESDASDVTDGRDAPLERARRLRRWKVALAADLAAANGGVAYTAVEGAETLLLVAARPADRVAVATIWEWLVKRIEWLSATEGAGRSRDWHEAFRIGAAEVIVARLAAAGGEEAALLPAAALVRIEPARAARMAAVEAFVERNLRLGRGRGVRVDARGLERGRKAGANVSLRR